MSEKGRMRRIFEIKPEQIRKVVINMSKFFITYNDYFGFCVIEEINGTQKIVFAGNIEDCNKKCIELNNSI